MNHNKLQKKLQSQIRMLQQSEQNRPTLLSQTAYIGTLGLLIVLPTVGGAYLGHWLDSQVEGYSVRWTISLIVLGVIVGAVNIYWFIKERE